MGSLLSDRRGSRHHPVILPRLQRHLQKGQLPQHRPRSATRPSQSHPPSHRNRVPRSHRCPLRTLGQPRYDAEPDRPVAGRSIDPQRATARACAFVLPLGLGVSALDRRCAGRCQTFEADLPNRRRGHGIDPSSHALHLLDI